MARWLLNPVMWFVVGAAVGSLVNLAVCRLALHPRAFSPWSHRAKADTTAFPWWYRVPLIGWFGLSRHARTFGRGFWIRPLGVEIAGALALASLAWWEVDQRGLIARQVEIWLGNVPAPQLQLPLGILAAGLASHAVLFALMFAASLIDIDEKLIPDALTIPGTILGWIIAMVLPWSLLPHVSVHAQLPPYAQPLEIAGGPVLGELEPVGILCVQWLSLAAPRNWPHALRGAPAVGSLVLGLGCFWLWCFAIAPRTWYARHGWKRACKHFAARFFRSHCQFPLVLLIPMGTLTIVLMWLMGDARWAALLTSLVGLAVGGGLVWAVRLIGKWTLKKEAMGFGDVTLMAMIGSFLGWQPCLIIFFLAPFAGLVVGLAQWLLVRDQVVPYGPFLCLAATMTIVYWADIWNAIQPIFEIGWLVPLTLVVCLAAMWILLTLWRLLLAALHIERWS